MKNIYKIIFLIILLILLTTYNPANLNLQNKNDTTFFKIKNIEVINSNLINKDIITNKLDKIIHKNILTINKKDIEDPLANIDFLEKIQVKKKYPDTISIKVFETFPIAIIIKKEKKYFLDSSSNLVIYNKNLSQYEVLPNIFGKNVEKYFADFLKKLKDNNFPYKQIKNYYYFEIGRWDIQLLDDKIIKLPNNKIITAIKKTNELLSNKEFENYNVIDLRINDKIIVE
tara:strand:- start:19 stop:705 length:687 start_codon:yes stop_codon:yes gene_type:complete